MRLDFFKGKLGIAIKLLEIKLWLQQQLQVVVQPLIMVEQL
jgi:hypothetical protein